MARELCRDPAAHEVLALWQEGSVADDPFTAAATRVTVAI
jgi:hypothetical protein